MRRGDLTPGYTLVEVMVALTVLGVGILGALSMESATIAANHRAQEVTLASNIARRWQERLTADALMWNSPSARTSVSDLGTDTSYLCSLVGCTGGSAHPQQWVVPIAPVGSPDSPAYDTFGNEIPLGSASVVYCANLRVSWLRADAPARQGIIRAEIRVWWFREGVTHNAAYVNCGTPALQTLGADTATLDFVYASSVIAGNPL